MEVLIVVFLTVHLINRPVYRVNIGFRELPGFFVNFSLSFCNIYLTANEGTEILREYDKFPVKRLIPEGVRDLYFMC
jgi:hypothetical protein